MGRGRTGAESTSDGLGEPRAAEKGQGRGVCAAAGRHGDCEEGSRLAICGENGKRC